MNFRLLSKNPLVWSFLLLPLLSCEKSTGPGIYEPEVPVLPPLLLEWTDQQSIVCFGTSITAGYTGFGHTAGPIVPGTWTFDSSLSRKLLAAESYSWPDYAYPAQLGKTLKIRVYNQGYLGATTQRALTLVFDSVLSKSPVLVLLEFGANDLLQGIDASVAEQRLDSLIGIIEAAGSQVVLISFLYPEMIQNIPPDHPLAGEKEIGWTYLEMLRRVASENSIQIVEYALVGIYWYDEMMSDDIHPNEAGYKRMQENISRSLSRTFSENGMLANQAFP